VLFLSPLMVVVAAAALYLAVRRRDLGILAPIAIFGGGLGFDLLAYAGNSIESFLRYFITAVPLEVLLVGSLFSAAPALIRLTGPESAPVDRRSTAGRMSRVFSQLLPASWHWCLCYLHSQRLCEA